MYVKDVNVKATYTLRDGPVLATSDPIDDHTYCAVYHCEMCNKHLAATHYPESLGPAELQDRFLTLSRLSVTDGTTNIAELSKKGLAPNDNFYVHQTREHQGIARFVGFKRVVRSVPVE